MVNTMKPNVSEALKALINSAEEDMQKAAGGNRAAGTRVRKAMQEVKSAAQDLRVSVLEDRGDGGGGS